MTPPDMTVFHGRLLSRSAQSPPAPPVAPAAGARRGPGVPSAWVAVSAGGLCGELDTAAAEAAAVGYGKGRLLLPHRLRAGPADTTKPHRPSPA